MVGAVASTVVLLFGTVFVLGRGAGSSAPASNPVRYIGGVPVVVDHSPAGALTAADNYVAASYASVELNPVKYARLIRAVYSPAIRTAATSGAVAVRDQNLSAMRLWARGGHSLSLIGGRRLDYYSDDKAQISTWNADVFWGPGRPPKQAWVLTQMSLRWVDDRWLVTSIATLPTGGPVPALTPQAATGNDSVATFDTALAGFTPPSYGAVR